MHNLFKKNKAQGAQQVFIYIITVIVLGMIMIFGYRAITGVKERSEQVIYIKLRSELENSIKQLSSDYGSTVIKRIEVPPKFTKICFVDNELIDAGTVGVTGGKYPIIDDSVKDKVRNNVFMVPDGSDAVYVGKIDAEPNFFCTDVTQGTIRIKLEGLGDRTRITEYAGAVQN